MLLCVNSYAQVRIVNNTVNDQAISSSAFIDASSNTGLNATTNIGKGLLFPRVNLTNFVFSWSGTAGIGNNYATCFDGMIVYNSGTGATLTTGNNPSVSVNVTPGFYYFHNPTCSPGTHVRTGTWKRLDIGGDIGSITNLGDSIAYYISKTVLGDTIMNYITQNLSQELIDSIINQISKDVNITKLGDSIAYYISKTVLGDTIMNYITQNISQDLIDSIMNNITKEINITKLGDEIANYFNQTNLGDTIMKYFSLNMSKDFVTNMGDEIALYFSQTDLKDTINNIINNTINANAWGLNGNAITAGKFIGTTNAQPVIVKVNNSEVLRVGNTGNIGLEVKGAATNTASYNANATRTIDFTQSNLAYTTATAGSFTLNGMKDGGTYTLAVQNTTGGVTASFTADGGLTVKTVNNDETVAGHTLYTIVVINTTAYVYMATGFN